METLSLLYVIIHLIAITDMVWLYMDEIKLYIHVIYILCYLFIVTDLK